MNSDIPNFLYGTAWKKDKTEEFTFQAIELGMRGIDTANQLIHYNEIGVGSAVSKAISNKLVERREMFLQTKFTYVEFQNKDGFLPFDPSDAADKQLRSSFENSLEHFDTDYLDSYLIHGPESSVGLSENDKLLWREMEKLADEKKVVHIGVSNFSADQIDLLVDFAKIKPKFVQNRCYPTIKWDSQAQEVCKKHGITYQGFNLQRDPHIQDSAYWASLSQKYDLPITTIVYSYARQAGMLPLTGATQLCNLKENLRALDDLLTQDEFDFINRAAFMNE